MSDCSDDYFFSMSSCSSSESLKKREKPNNNVLYKLMPDGKLATICTMVMIFSCVISIKLYIDDDVEDDIIDKVKEGKKSTIMSI